MKIFLLLLFPAVSVGQKINPPVWDKATVYLETAKIQKGVGAGNFGPEQFKTSNITIMSADRPEPNFIIDIPDIYYGKSFTFYNKTYTEPADGPTYITYVLLSDDKKTMVGLTFYFQDYTSLPVSIFFSVQENINTKTAKTRSYMLTEFK